MKWFVRTISHSRWHSRCIAIMSGFLWLSSLAFASTVPWQAELDAIHNKVLTEPEKAVLEGRAFQEKYEAVAPYQTLKELDIRLAYARFLLGDGLNAYQQLEQLKLDIPANNSALQASVQHTIGNVYAFNGDVAEALNAYYGALTLRENIGDPSLMAATLNNIAIQLNEANQYRAALDYYQRVLQIGQQQKNALDIGDAEVGMATVYIRMADYHNAALANQRAILAFNEGDPQYWGAISALAQIDEIAVLRRQSDTQDRSFWQALKLAEKAKQPLLRAELFRAQADAYLTVDDYAQALTLASQGIALIQQEHQQPLSETRDRRSAIYVDDKNLTALNLIKSRALFGMGRLREAAPAYEQWRMLTHRYNDARAVLQAQMMQIRYSAQQKELAIANLTKQNELQALRLQQTTWQKNAWIAGLILLIAALAAIALYWSHRQQLKRQQELNQHLLKLDRIKDQVLANTSHELRTPLNGIVGLTEIMLTEEMSAEHHHMVDLIARSGRRLSFMVNDLLDFAKLKHSEVPLETEMVNLRSAATQALEICQPAVGDKNLRLLNEIQNEKLFVSANADRLQQILCNLINNAIKFSEAGLIRVSAQLEGSQKIKVTVSDNGMGIPSDDQQRIFEPFEQVDGSLSRRHEGTGLGLAICKKLVELHGGQIGVQSTPGLGSQFWFTLNKVM